MPVSIVYLRTDNIMALSEFLDNLVSKPRDPFGPINHFMDLIAFRFDEKTSTACSLNQYPQTFEELINDGYIRLSEKRGKIYKMHKEKSPNYCVEIKKDLPESKKHGSTNFNYARKVYEFAFLRGLRVLLFTASQDVTEHNLGK